MMWDTNIQAIRTSRRLCSSGDSESSAFCTSGAFRLGMCFEDMAEGKPEENGFLCVCFLFFKKRKFLQTSTKQNDWLLDCVECNYIAFGLLLRCNRIVLTVLWSFFFFRTLKLRSRSKLRAVLRARLRLGQTSSGRGTGEPTSGHGESGHWVPPPSSLCPLLLHWLSISSCVSCVLHPRNAGIVILYHPPCF